MSKKPDNSGKFLNYALIGLVGVSIIISKPWAAPIKSESAIEKVVENYIQNNPEKVVAALQSGQKKSEEAKMAEAKKILADSGKKLFADNLPFVGNKDGKHHVIEFFDYNCGYCKKALPEIKQLIEQNKDVKLSFVEFPIFGERSDLPARAALAVNKIDPTKYFAFHSALMEFQGNKTEEMLLEAAKKLGVDPKKVKALLTDKGIADEIAANRELGNKLGIRGTPAFVIGDELVPGYLDHKAMLEKLKS